MQALQDRINPSALGRLRLRMRGMLRAPGSQYAPEQSAGRSDAGSYPAFSGFTEPRKCPRLRQAEFGETGLSVAEVEQGRRIGEIA